MDRLNRWLVLSVLALALFYQIWGYGFASVALKVLSSVLVLAALGMSGTYVHSWAASKWKYGALAQFGLQFLLIATAIVLSSGAVVA